MLAIQFLTRAEYRAERQSISQLTTSINVHILQILKDSRAQFTSLRAPYVTQHLVKAASAPISHLQQRFVSRAFNIRSWQRSVRPCSVLSTGVRSAEIRTVATHVSRNILSDTPSWAYGSACVVTAMVGNSVNILQKPEGS
jgi:hypothetical protein